MKLVEVTDLKTKKLCYKKFAKAYKKVVPPTQVTFGPLRKYLAALVDGKIVGFIVLTNKSGFYSGLEVWCASEAFVEPKYRSKGYLRQMLVIAIRDHNVRLAHIEQKRFWANADYYLSLGFVFPIGNAELVFVRVAKDVALMDRHYVGKPKLNVLATQGSK